VTQDLAFFGYGSLVNALTHAYDDPRPAKLHGWRRAWRHTHHRPVSFLTAVPAPQDATLWGMVAAVPSQDWAELDAREYAYTRVMVTENTHVLSGVAASDVAVYAIAPGDHHAPQADHPVLQSYLDTVLQGYLKTFGEAGLAHFVATTDGWDAPILQDRAAPRYPRATELSDRERCVIDAVLDPVVQRIPD